MLEKETPVTAGGNGSADPLAEHAAAVRARAIEIGRQLGEQEAERAGEIADEREQRVARAMAYAAWEADGKPESFAEYREEFGLVRHDVTESADRAPFRRLGSDEKLKGKR